MGRVKTIHNSSHSVWKYGFLFLGNHLILDFLNTRPIQNGEPVELLPDFGALLKWYQAAGILSSGEAAGLGLQWRDSPRARCTVEAMRELRESLRKEVLAWEHGSKVHRGVVDELNRLMTEHPMLIRMRARGSESSTEMWFEPRQPENLFAPLAYSAAALFAKADRRRVRKCNQCVLHFYDKSKKGTRRWCSMQLCGNRFKVAAYAARERMRARE